MRKKKGQGPTHTHKNAFQSSRERSFRKQTKLRKVEKLSPKWSPWQPQTKVRNCPPKKMQKNEANEEGSPSAPSQQNRHRVQHHHQTSTAWFKSTCNNILHSLGRVPNALQKRGQANANLNRHKAQKCTFPYAFRLLSDCL